MTYLFSRSNDDLLATFAGSNVLLAFDYDGTLAPLVAAPERATLRASTRRLLKRASTLYPCVVISGRTQGDALGRLRGVEIRRIVVRIVGGKLVVNCLVPDAPHKGLALDRERAHLACDRVIYVGDDETDEDVFRLDRPTQLLSIRVGRKRTSAAPYYIRNQAEIDRLLETLITLRGDQRD